MMLRLFLFSVFVFIVACTPKDVQIGKSEHPVNLKIIQEAHELFENKLENQESYRSYSSSDIFYEIKSKNLSMVDFSVYKDEVLPRNNWIFFKKVDQGYIFCKGSRQLEMIPPQKIVGNESLGSGDIGKQQEDVWNIMFSNTLNGTLNACYKHYIELKNK